MNNKLIGIVIIMINYKDRIGGILNILKNYFVYSSLIIY